LAISKGTVIDGSNGQAQGIPRGKQRSVDTPGIHTSLDASTSWHQGMHP